MKIFSTVNISKLNLWLVICIAKNFIWTTLKAIFSIFRFFCTFRFQMNQYCPNHTSMEILLAFRWCINLNYIFFTLMTGFVVTNVRVSHLSLYHYLHWLKVVSGVLVLVSVVSSLVDTVIWTGICRSLTEHQYHPVFSFFSRFMLTVTTPFLFMISTDAPSKSPLGSDTHFPASLHHFISVFLGKW